MAERTRSPTSAPFKAVCWPAPTSGRSGPNAPRPTHGLRPALLRGPVAPKRAAEPAADDPRRSMAGRPSHAPHPGCGRRRARRFSAPLCNMDWKEWWANGSEVRIVRANGAATGGRFGLHRKGSSPAIRPTRSAKAASSHRFFWPNAERTGSNVRLQEGWPPSSPCPSAPPCWTDCGNWRPPGRRLKESAGRRTPVGPSHSSTFRCEISGKERLPGDCAIPSCWARLASPIRAAPCEH